MSHWPKRDAICLDCRTTFSDSDQPHDADHTLVSLTKPNQRTRLINRVWGRTEFTARTRASAKLLSVIIPSVLTVIAFPTFVRNNVPSIVIVGLFAALWVGIDMLIQGRMLKLVKHRSRTNPLPAAATQPALPEGREFVGKVQQGATARAPLSLRHAVAFSITLGGSRFHAVSMLTDAASVGFAVVTENGDEIRVPAGRIELHGRASEQRAQQTTIARYLKTIDPLRKSSDDPDPFQHEYGAEVVVQVGDRVAIHSPIERVGFDAAAGYRDAARQVFRVQGTPHIELLATAATVRQHAERDAAPAPHATTPEDHPRSSDADSPPTDKPAPPKILR